VEDPGPQREIWQRNGAAGVATRTASNIDVAIGLQQYEDKDVMTLPFEIHLVLSE
jgi:hypothetical protein